MNKNYQPILLDKITDEIVIEILNAVIPVFKELEIEYFVVGAFARDVELLAKGYNDPPARKTRDLDLAVMLSSEEEDNFTEAVTARYIGRKTGALIKDSEKIQNRVLQILTDNIADPANSPMGKIMSFETL